MEAGLPPPPIKIKRGVTTSIHSSALVPRGLLAKLESKALGTIHASQYSSFLEDLFDTSSQHLFITALLWFAITVYTLARIKATCKKVRRFYQHGYQGSIIPVIQSISVTAFIVVLIGSATTEHYHWLQVKEAEARSAYQGYCSRLQVSYMLSCYILPAADSVQKSGRPSTCSEQYFPRPVSPSIAEPRYTVLLCSISFILYAATCTVLLAMVRHCRAVARQTDLESAWELSMTRSGIATSGTDARHKLELSRDVPIAVPSAEGSKSGSDVATHGSEMSHEGKESSLHHEEVQDQPARSHVFENIEIDSTHWISDGESIDDDSETERSIPKANEAWPRHPSSDDGEEPRVVDAGPEFIIGFQRSITIDHNKSRRSLASPTISSPPRSSPTISRGTSPARRRGLRFIGSWSDDLEAEGPAMDTFSSLDFIDSTGSSREE